MRFIVLLMSVVTFAELSAQDQQDDTFKAALFLKVDNDAFLAQTVDRYYSSGIFFQFRKLAPEGSFPSRMMKNKAKAIQSFQFAHVFYTAQDLRLRTIDQLDRPYAGYMSLAYGVDYYFNNNSFIKLEIEGGILGPSAKMAEFQKWYHKIIDARVPRGWRYQIEDAPLMQLKSAYSKLILNNGNFELYNESSVRLGTVFDNKMGKISSNE